MRLRWPLRGRLRGPLRKAADWESERACERVPERGQAAASAGSRLVRLSHGGHRDTQIS